MARRKLSLYGKKTTSDDILEEIHRLLYAKGNRPYPLRPSEIAKIIGISRKTVYDYIQKLSKRGDVVRLPSGHFFFPKTDEFREFNKHHEITSDPMISEWMDDLLTRKQGFPVKTWRNRLRCVEMVPSEDKWQYWRADPIPIMSKINLYVPYAANPTRILSRTLFVKNFNSIMASYMNLIKDSNLL